MSDPAYAFRGKRGAVPVEYTALPDALAWRDRDGNELSLPYRDIREIRVYRAAGVDEGPPYRACVIVPAKGDKITISNRHFLGDGSLEDRSDSYRSFERALFERAVKAHPDIAFVRGGQTAWLLFAIVFGLVALFVASVLYSLARAVIGGEQAGEDAWVTLAICIVLIVFSIPGIRLLRRKRFGAFDPLAPDQ